MFSLAILIGIYSYLVFALGLLGILYKQIVILLTLSFLATIIYVSWRPPRRSPFGHLRGVSKDLINLGKLGILSSILLILQAVINLIGALGPELGFDALWYHLTIPKLFLENHSAYYIPGGLLYYSLTPKLTEMLYVSALSFNGEILAKLIHFSFGILSSIALYKLSRIFFTPKISLIAIVVFYSNLVVAWQSTTAYVDLARTFFEIMALWGFVNWWREKKLRRLIESAIMLGLAISTKLLALGSLLIFSALIVYSLFSRNPPRRSHGFSRLSRDQPATIRGVTIIRLFVYWVICLLIPLPWFVFSFVNTGNPIYPFFTDVYKVGFNVDLLNPFRFVREVWAIFMESSDPISPVYIIFLPLIVLLYKTFKPDIKLITIYSFLSIIVWYITPRTGGGRFILPYLPEFSILIVAIIDKLRPPRRSPFDPRLSSKRTRFAPFHLRGVAKPGAVRYLARRLLGGDLRSVLISVIIIVSIISILYRGIANAKYIPVIVETQTKSEFLATNLNFSFGDFYDTDGYFKKIIRKDDKVLLYGFHNLYYVDFPFIDSSWVKKGDSFNYIAVQNTDLPKKFKDWDIIYINPKTNVKLYSKGGIKWTY